MLSNKSSQDIFIIDNKNRGPFAADVMPGHGWESFSGIFTQLGDVRGLGRVVSKAMSFYDASEESVNDSIDAFAAGCKPPLEGELKEQFAQSVKDMNADDLSARQLLKNDRWDWLVSLEGAK